jgi:hypothetical protein
MNARTMSRLSAAAFRRLRDWLSCPVFPIEPIVPVIWAVAMNESEHSRKSDRGASEAARLTVRAPNGYDEELKSDVNGREQVDRSMGLSGWSSDDRIAITTSAPRRISC